ncbi:SRPBCC family protein [Aeribacillus pallidus]|uniref:SRPBCC family protein n=1 Tax=Aeribacillus pallidus TaxID=33936 RepID=UPI0007B03A0F|nr:SRPBCC domain-containing protein [Aeribacillus pallidus]
MGEWLTVKYGQLLGRIPVGVTKDAGVQIGVRKTIKVEKEKVWDYLTSPHGLLLWIGDVSEFRLQKGYEFKSKEGICGKLTVVLPFRKLRMKWKLPEWEKPSRLQLYLLPTDSGKTTIAISQEMLDDVYVRELMRRFWADKLEQIKNYLEGRNE